MIRLRLPHLNAGIVGLLTFIALTLVSRFQATAFNNYVVLADALLHGHIWFNGPNPYVDALRFEGKYYVIEAPMPAILLMPLVAIQGLSANQTLLAIVLASIAMAAAWEIGAFLDVPQTERLWLCGFLLLGTDLFWCAMYGGVWLIAHVSAVAFTLLALRELFGKRRAWLVAIFAACATGSRFSMILAIPTYAFLLWRESEQTSLRLRRLGAFTATLIPFVALWIAYNQARWHVPYDIGYTAFYRQGGPTGSPFGLENLGYEVSSFFFELPQFISKYPYVVPTIYGMALTWTSPALILACFARGTQLRRKALWAAALATAFPNFIYFANGYSQFGMRHALDFEPFLFVLMLLAARNGLSRWQRALCAYSMLIGIWGVWYWLTFYPPI